MDKQLWKRVERKCAEMLGGRRVPVTGRQRGDVPDIEHPWLALEVKSRRTFPEWIRDAVAQSEAAAVGHENKMPLVVIAAHNGHGKEIEWFVVQKMSTWMAWNLEKQNV